MARPNAGARAIPPARLEPARRGSARPDTVPTRHGRPSASAPAPHDPRAAHLAKLDRYAELMDSRFRVPLLGWRFGLDTLLGLVPGIGDLATAAPQAWLIWQGWRMGAGRRTLTRMAGNTALDLTLGSVPILGDAFDMFFKANLRNVALLRRDVRTRR